MIPKTDFTDLLLTIANNSGYSVELRDDMGAWRKTLEDNGALAVTMFHERDLWLDCRFDGNTIATNAMVRGEGPLVDWMQTGFFKGTRHCLPPGFDLHGKFHYRGGMWVHPDHRGKGLPWLLPRLFMALAVHEQADWTIGHCFEDIYVAGIPQVYAYTGARLYCDAEFFTPAQRTGTLYLLTASLMEMRGQIARELPLISGEDSLPAAFKRIREAGVLPPCRAPVVPVDRRKDRSRL